MYTITTERKSRKRVVPKKALKIKTNIEKKITNGSVELRMWTGKYTGTIAFLLSPQSSREAAVVLAKLREALPDANPDFEISEIACESTARRGSLQFSYGKVSHRDQ